MSEGRTRGDGHGGEPEGAVPGASGHRPTLREFVGALIADLFVRLDGNECEDLYRLVVREVEGSLLEAVMRETSGNQVRAARILGINRGTLRKKLRSHGLLEAAPQPTGGGGG